MDAAGLRPATDESRAAIARAERPYVAWFTDPAGSVLSLIEM
jgi:hypothetical protein